MSKGDIALGLIAPSLEFWLIIRLFVRQLYREFPFFFSYLICSILIAIVRLWAIANHIYIYVFWATAAVYNIMALLVLYEAFHHVFLAFYRQWRWFWSVFPATAVLLLFLSVWEAIRHPMGSVLTDLIFVFGFAVNFAQLGLFGLFFLLVTLFSIGWQNYPFAIVTGFASSALGSLISYWLASEQDPNFNTLVKYCQPVSYILALVIWLLIFSSRKPITRFTMNPDQLRRELQRYAEIMKRIRGRVK